MIILVGLSVNQFKIHTNYVFVFELVVHILILKLKLFCEKLLREGYYHFKNVLSDISNCQFKNKKMSYLNLKLVKMLHNIKLMH